LIAIFELIDDNLEKKNQFEEYYNIINSDTMSDSISSKSGSITTSCCSSSKSNNHTINRMMSKNMVKELNDFNSNNYVCYGSIDPNNLFQNQVIVTQNDLINYNKKNNSLGNFLVFILNYVL
jgi:hypothetical protein